jgi:putative hemolysin
MTEFIILLLLILLNGVLAMSEAAVIASRRARLQQLVEEGSSGAKAALVLLDDPNRFLSTVQIGITLVGILSGAFGGATLGDTIAAQLATIPALAPYSQTLSIALIVAVTTYLSLIIGELVPKRLALQNPEQIAAMVALPMRTLSRVTSPLVSLLSVSTNGVLKLIGVADDEQPPVSEEEIKLMMMEGISAGVFEKAEHDMVEGIFKLGDRRVRTIMTPRTEIDWIDIEDSVEEMHRRLLESKHSRFPVAKGGLDDILGVVYAKDLLARSLRGESFDLQAVIREPLFVPEAMPAGNLLELFRARNMQIALVIGEYGDIQGLVSIHDLLEEIVGDIEEPSAVQRGDGSWLLDGMIATDEFKDILDIDDELPGEAEDFDTLGGFVMSQLGRIPTAADHFQWQALRFEVMDMDGNRVDKVLVSLMPDAEVSSHEGHAPGND